jgi:hypothetical protein
VVVSAVKVGAVMVRAQVVVGRLSGGRGAGAGMATP